MQELIHTIIRLLSPYYFIYSGYKKNNFITDHYKLKDQWKTIKFEDSCKFSTIVSVQGFGFSGSGALVDLLREYTECCVLGGVDEDGSKTQKTEDLTEFDFLRMSGGLWEIEKYLDSKNVFFNDALLNRLSLLFFKSKLYKVSSEARNLMHYFFNELIELELPNLKGAYYNPYLADITNRTSIFYMKHISKKDYIQIVRKFLYSLFNKFHKSGKTVLVVDQMCGDQEFNYTEKRYYFDNLKVIVIYRDPRDIYYYAIKNNVAWIAHDCVEDFVKWCRIMYSNFNKNSNEYLAVRFEELVTEYGKVKKDLETYIGIKKHELKKCNFDPEISFKNIGIWKSSNVKYSDFEYIRENLPDYLFWK